MLRKIGLLLNTIKYLKPVQFQYQLRFRLKKPLPLTAYRHPYRPEQLQLPSFTASPPQPSMASKTGKDFRFLNITQTFDDHIDWNFQTHGKLWNYNLQYANYLLQDGLSSEIKKALWHSLHEWLYSGELSLEPYPVSLRVINGIRFLSASDAPDAEMLSDMHAELTFLTKRLEFHLLGNHLLENYFALLMGGAMFSEQSWIMKAEKGLQKQLNAQVLRDGAHFELSPMYHQIILFRMLELLDWYAKWKDKKPDFESFIKRMAVKMLTWLQQISFQNGDIPHFNDSATGIAPPTSWLLQYGSLLKIDPDKQQASPDDSGYRKFDIGNYECRIDAAAIGASYQPGHAHADALSFILYVNGYPMLTEQGTSTYQIGARRNLERSTGAHNTVVINNQNQSQVWGGFRVGRRAKVRIESETGNSFAASHDGYQKQGVIHRRHFQFQTDRIIITDELTGETASACAFFHFHPSLSKLHIDLNKIIEFKHAHDVIEEPYKMAEGYNRYLEGIRIKATFKNKLITIIHVNRI
ncbi:alginate lyase family protein [Niabella sp.]|uniref:alginate lyase family protein n=1 Tax=Niabella sp. TaxID=1962976 RepID=UPI0026219156|nr:alginate lyase family protein [Niabella sp.]